MLVYIWLPFAFLLGACVGSLVNVCVFRLPSERSLFWPGSRCAKCLQPIHWYDNMPLVSYWVLRGRCRTCGQAFSVRYFLVELLTGVAFAGLFYLEIICNVLNIPALRHQEFNFTWGTVPGWAWVVWLHHAVLFSFLLIVSLCDLDEMEIPLGVTVTGTIVGLVLATLLPWPFPNPDNPYALIHRQGAPPVSGLYAWPVWYQVQVGLVQPPQALPAGSWRLGLCTGLVGALVGMLVLRGVRFVFSWGRGIEGLGLGDADLMMMAGAFIGWQPVVMAFFVSAFPALAFGIAQVLRKGDQRLPFGPSLAAGVMLTLLLWPSLGRHFWPLYSEPLFLGLAASLGAILLLVTALLLRLMRGVPPDAPADSD